MKSDSPNEAFSLTGQWITTVAILVRQGLIR